MANIKECFRLGKVREDNRPRLIMVKATEKTVKQFLTRSKLLKQASSPLDKIFLQENLPSELNKRLADMRKKAYEHRTQNPGDTAFVKNKKLFINGQVVDEINQNF